MKDDFIVPDLSNGGKLDELIETVDDLMVRLAATFDMGWTTRGGGHSYDSLSGMAALIGFFTKKILIYACLNRKCRRCDLQHDPKDHDCRKN